jgi:hypothetical protein
VVVLHAPLSGGFLDQARADELRAEGFFADDAVGLASAWSRLCSRWDTATERARGLPTDTVHERVDGEWSFVETLRHLLFVTDVWVRDVIQEETRPHHPWGVPPHFVADQAPGWGLDLSARPSMPEVLAVRLERQALVGLVIAEQTQDSLLRTCAPRDGQFQVIGALQTVLFEEWAHLQYAERDLWAIEERVRE